MQEVQEMQVGFLDRENSPGVGSGNQLQYSRRENSMDRGAWPATVPVAAKKQMQLSTHNGSRITLAVYLIKLKK